MIFWCILHTNILEFNGGGFKYVVLNVFTPDPWGFYDPL